VEVRASKKPVEAAWFAQTPLVTIRRRATSRNAPPALLVDLEVDAPRHAVDLVSPVPSVHTTWYNCVSMRTAHR